jgi:transcription termination factor 2
MEEEGKGGFLADEMGLGKTLTMVTFLLLNKIHRMADLIVCPLSLMRHWKREIKRVYKSRRLPKPRILIHHGPKRRAIMENETRPWDYIITTYSILGSGELNQHRWGRVVLDESHYIKNGLRKKPVKCALAAYTVGRHAQFNWCISGTPFNNRMKDIASQCKFIGTFPYNNPVWWKQQRGGKNPENIQHWREKFVLRRTKEGLIAPPQYYDIEVTPSKKERALFDSLRSQAEFEYKKWRMSTGREKMRHQGCILGLIQRLRIVSNSFHCGDHLIDVDEVMEHNAKVRTMVNEIDQQLTQDPQNSVVVFSQFTSFLDVLEEVIEGVMHGVEVYKFTGSMSAQERDEIVAEFKADTSPRVLLVSLMAGGCGLTLVPSATVFLSEPYYNPFVEKQAEERVHRIGQTNQVCIFRFRMERSVETWIQRLKKKKLWLATNLDLVADRDMVMTFSMDDLKDLFNDMVGFKKEEKPSKKKLKKKRRRSD